MLEGLSQSIHQNLDKVIIEVTKTFSSNGKLFICGNGGSAADAQHIAAEFVNGMSHPNDLHFAAIALTTDTSILTSHANDYSFDGVFEVQLKALASPGDCVLLLSTSGKSRNITQALKYCRESHITSILITGENAFQNDNQTIVLNIPSTDTQIIQEISLMIEHYICEKVIENMKKS